MNKTARVILGLVIALLFPTLVYYAVVTFLPDPAPLNLSQPVPVSTYSCPNQVYSQTPGSGRNCGTSVDDQQNYQTALTRYNAELKDYQDKVAALDWQRPLLALALALVGLASAAALREIPELMAGLAGGAALVMLWADGRLISGVVPTVQFLRGGVLLITAIILTAMLSAVDRVLGQSDSVKLQPLTPEPAPKDPV